MAEKPFPTIMDDLGVHLVTDSLYTRQSGETISIVFREAVQGVHLSAVDARLLAFSLRQLARAVEGGG